jgi:putative ABC transport system permease protein
MGNMLEQVVSDCRHALRLLRNSPVFAGVAILSLALGVGANVAIFSLANAVMLKVLPVHEPQRLVRLVPGDQRRGGFFTNAIWEQIRDRDDLFDGSFAWSLRRFNVSSRGEIDRVPGIMASGDFFDVLGVRAIVGRTFTRADDRRGGGPDGPVAVISYGWWQSRYAGSLDVLGRSIFLDGHEFTIIGVTPPEFFGVEVGQSFSVAVPLATDVMFSGNAGSLDRRDVWWLRIIGRLKPGHQATQALAALRASQPAIREATVPAERRPGDQRTYLSRPFELTEASSGTSGLRLRYRTTLFILMGIVGLVLLIACANVANVLLARALARRHEIAVRLAIGASRFRLIRQLLTESLVLSLLGAALGALFARWASRLLLYELSSRTTQVSLDLSLDWRILAFTTSVAFLSALLFGAAPALRSTNKHTPSALHGGVRSVTGAGSRSQLEKVLATLQVALSLVLVFGASLFVRSFASLLTVETGFDRQNVLIVSLDLQRTKARPDQRATIYDQVLESVRAVPGVESAAATLFAPISGAWSEGPVDVSGFESVPPDERRVYFNSISEDYFRTLGVPFSAGRDFGRADTIGGSRVAIVNEAFARKFFGGSNPVGQNYAQDGSSSTTIVGLVPDTKYRNLRDPAPPTVFLPARQRDEPEPWLHLFIRGSADVASLTTSVAAAISRVNETIEIDLRTLDRDIDDSLIQERLLATLSGFFGVLALLVASIGLYGLMSLTVTRRRREIGVRLALGAFPRSVIRMVLRDVWIVTGIGVVAGSIASLTTARLVSSLVYGLEPTDIATLAFAIVILCVTATLAGFFPARRAARFDPMTVLREQ